MIHNCLKNPPMWGDETRTKWEHDEPCSCECTYCLEFHRLRALPDVTEEEIEALWRMCTREATPGPWKATALTGFGGERFIVSESRDSQAQWYPVVAHLGNSGSFTGDEFIAWCRDGVPRLLKTIERLKQEKLDAEEEAYFSALERDLNSD